MTGGAAVAVSVVIPCYNSSAWVADTVASVIAQGFAALEIVVVDDGSTDATREVVARLIRNAASEVRMTLVTQANAGVAAARNRGIALACGSYILPVDADDQIAPGMVARCAAILDGDPEISIVYPDRQDFGALAATHASGAFQLARLKYFNQLPYCAMFRRAMWAAIGGYRANVSGFDDWDFWVAAAARGFRAHHLAAPLLLHRRHRGSQLSAIISDYERLYATLIVNNGEAYSPAELAAASRFLSHGEPAALLHASKRIFTARYAVV